MLDEKRRKLLQEGEALKSERNRASKEIGAVKAKGGDIAESVRQGESRWRSNHENRPGSGSE